MKRLLAMSACILAVAVTAPSCLRDEFWNVPVSTIKKEERREPARVPAKSAPIRDEKQPGGKKEAVIARTGADYVEESVRVVVQQLSDYAGEAAVKGYHVPVAPVTADARFTTRHASSIVTDVPSVTRAKTPAGVLVASITVPWRTAGERLQVYLVNNGVISPLDLAVLPGKFINRPVVLGRGVNYIAVGFMAGGRWIARTPVVLIESEAQGSLGRFELTWDGRGDMDLNLDVRAPGGHIGRDNPAYRENGYHIVLDVDNTEEYGPESLRVISIPGAVTVTCYVNYYSGYEARKATVRYYDRDNRLLKTYSRSFVPGQAYGTVRFNDKSWVVDRITLNP